MTIEDAKSTCLHPAGSELERRRAGVICLALFVLTLGVFWPALHGDFLSYDDDGFVTNNRYVSRGFTSEGWAWAWTTGHYGLWHPLTWLSHMLDAELYGLYPGGHHATSLFIHAASVVLLFLWLRNMTGALWRSACVAALFGLHPLRVESVAWIAERKDVLGAFFWMLTLLAYARYAASLKSRAGAGPGVKDLAQSAESKPVWLRYVVVVLCFALALLSKATVVTLPCVLLLLDCWPLRRLDLKEGDFRKLAEDGAKLIGEKAPLFVMSAAAVLVNVLASRHSGAMRLLSGLPRTARFENASVCYVKYLSKMFWPSPLAVFYPHPLDALPAWQVASALALLLGVSVGVVLLVRRRPYLFVGWFWYVGVLVPTVGFVQAGTQAMADRYSYLPSVGIALAVTWGASDVLGGSRPGRAILSTCAALALVAMAAGTRAQLLYWRDTATLFEHTLRVTEKNAVAHNNFGRALYRQGRYDEAVKQFRAALAIRPDHPWAAYNMANALLAKGDTDAAIAEYDKAIPLNPEAAIIRINLGNALLQKHNVDEAITRYGEALALDPDQSGAHANLSVALLRQGHSEEALDHAAAALSLDPKSADAHHALGRVLAAQGRIPEAIEHYEESLALSPENAQAHNDLGSLLAQQGHYAEAGSHFARALELMPDYYAALVNMAILLEIDGQWVAAAEHFAHALRLRPDSEAARDGLQRAEAQRTESGAEGGSIEQAPDSESPAVVEP